VNRPRPLFLLLLLVAVSFTLATVLQPRALAWNRRGDSGSVMAVLLGDSRRLFANQLFTKADVTFHSGYYPSIFDQAQAPKGTKHMTSEEGSSEAEEHERKMAFLGPPKDWIERFGRHFIITTHTHLEGQTEREILPWLKLSADLDPQRVDTYIVAAYWLRRELGKVAEAESFLREGLRNVPNSYELLFELGQLYQDNYHDSERARNVWELALRRWREQESDKEEPDKLSLEKITLNLGRIEERAGHLEKAISYLEMASQASPDPRALQRQISELKAKLAARPTAGQAGPR
jgi:tetratricopeptide (TPR) repeat protein